MIDCEANVGMCGDICDTLSLEVDFTAIAKTLNVLLTGSPRRSMTKVRSASSRFGTGANRDAAKVESRKHLSNKGLTRYPI
jgi:hypothetical protein